MSAAHTLLGIAQVIVLFGFSSSFAVSAGFYDSTGLWGVGYIMLIFGAGFVLALTAMGVVLVRSR